MFRLQINVPEALHVSSAEVERSWIFKCYLNEFHCMIDWLIDWFLVYATADTV
jgi:hypothetical protein